MINTWQDRDWNLGVTDPKAHALSQGPKRGGVEFIVHELAMNNWLRENE